jgi:hypothetical protein
MIEMIKQLHVLWACLKSPKCGAGKNRGPRNSSTKNIMFELDLEHE